MLKAGIPIVQALGIVGQGNENLSMRDLLSKIKTDVEIGDSLTQALRKIPNSLMIYFVILSKQVSAEGFWKRY